MKTKLVMATVLSLSLNVGLVSSAHALGITQTVVAITVLPTETVLALTFGVKKEVMIKAKNDAIYYGQTKQVSPFLRSFLNELRTTKAEAVQYSDDEIIAGIAGLDAE